MRFPAQTPAVRRVRDQSLPNVQLRIDASILPSESPVSGPCNPNTQITCGNGCCNAGYSCFGGSCNPDP
jgi:hypothetical protein